MEQRRRHYPPAIGYLRRMDHVVYDPRRRSRRVIVGGLLAAFPVPQNVGDWKALLNDYLDLPVPFYSYLPEAMKPKANNLRAVFDKAHQWWIDADQDRRSEAIEDTKATLCNLAQAREALNTMRRAFKALEARHGAQEQWPASAQKFVAEFNQLNTRYLLLASIVYGSAYPIDVKTGLPILPSGAQPAVLANIRAIRCPVSIFPTTPADAVGTDPVTATLIVAGIVGISVVVIALAVVLRPLSEAMRTDSERKSAEVLGDAAVKDAMVDVVRDPKASEAQKAAATKALTDIEEKERERAKGKKDLADRLEDLGMAVVVTGLALGAGYVALKVAEKKSIPSVGSAT